MPRSRVSPFQVRGPWRGLDTTRSPRELGPRDAAVAHNVIFRDGAITPRPPMIMDQGPFTAEVIRAGTMTQAVSVLGTPEFLRVRHVDYRLGGDSQGSIDNVNARPGTFVQAQGRLYYFDGLRGYILFESYGQRAWKRLGIPSPVVKQYLGGAPPAANVLWQINWTTNVISAEAALVPSHVYSFAFTWYDQLTDTESNATFTEDVQIPGPVPGRSYILQASFNGPPADVLGSRIRAYRRHVTGGQPFWMLIDQPHVTESGNPWIFAGEPLGNVDVGPFAPVKNGVPADMSMRGP